MAIQKNANLDISVAAEQNTNYNVKPSVQFSTQDRNTAKYTFTVKQNNKAIDLTDVTATVTLFMADKSVFQNNAVVTNAKEGKIEYTIPSDAIRHHGSAKGELKLTYANGDALGGLRFSFNIEQSLIDKVDGSQKEVYIEDFQTISNTVKKKAEEVTVKLDELDEEYQNKAYTVDEKLADVQATVNDLRENGTGIDAQARQEVQQVTEQLSDSMTNAQTQGQIQAALNTKQALTINIGRTVPISANLTIPENIRLVFRNGGKLSVKSGVTLTINGHIEAGFYQIFEFESETSIITTTKYKGDVSLDWFGADPNVDFNSSTYVISGKDSSFAFKKCMSFVQDSKKIALKYTPNARYYVSGDNPCGFQKNLNASCRVMLQGNGSRIYWKPLLNTDNCFGKLGLLHYSEISNFEVYTIGESGDRKGTVFNTKLGFTNIHFFSRNKFDSIGINNDDFLFGCDKVFNFEPDGTHSHDDLSEFKNISATRYNTFVNIANNESVKNTFTNCATTSYTDGACTFKLSSTSFSGYLSIIDHHFTVFNSDEKIIYTAAQSSNYPINIERPRMEVRGNTPFVFCEANSMDVYINSLNFLPGGGTPVYSNNYFIVGQDARIIFDRCNSVFGNIMLKERTKANNLSDAVIARNSSFLIRLHPTASLTNIAYPDIRYEGYASRKDAIIAGKAYKPVRVSEMSSTNDAYNLPVIYSSTGKREYVEATLTKFVAGKTVISGSFNMPSDMVIESVYLNVAAFDTSQVNNIKVNFHKTTGSLARSYSTSLSANTKVSKELVTSGRMLTMPFHTVVEIIWEKDGVVVGNESLLPQSDLRIKYRSIMTSHEANNGNGGEIDLM